MSLVAKGRQAMKECSRDIRNGILMRSTRVSGLASLWLHGTVSSMFAVCGVIESKSVLQHVLPILSPRQAFGAAHLDHRQRKPPPTHHRGVQHNTPLWNARVWSREPTGQAPPLPLPHSHAKKSINPWNVQTATGASQSEEQDFTRKIAESTVARNFLC